ncbi:MAG: DUF2141 domain-containing protein [Bacteroidota bacterium]
MNLILSVMMMFLMGTPPVNTNLTVHINDIEKPGEGVIYIMLWENEEGFPRTTANAKYTARISNFGASCSHTFDGIPRGEYAVSIYQDENENNELDTNFLGIPSEPIGAYNMNRIGRPNFSNSVIKLSQLQHTVRIKMLND